MTQVKWHQAFISSVIVILVGTAVAKLYSATGSAPILNRPDPLLILTTRQVLMLVGLIELAFAAYLLWSRDQSLKLLGTAWLATMFVIYRVGLWWTGASKSCSCLGSLGDVLPLSERALDYAMLVLLVYFWVGSVGLFLLMRGEGATQERIPAGKSADGVNKTARVL